MTRDGVPPIPAGTDPTPATPGAPSGSPSLPRSSERSGLFAEPSEKVIDAQEDLVIAERRVKKRTLDLQLEEIEDHFRERDARAEQAETKRQEALEAQCAAAKHREWVDAWTQTGLAQLPWDFPVEKRSAVIEQLRSKLMSCDAGQSDVITTHLIKSVVAGFTRPWERRREIERIVERTIPSQLRVDPNLKLGALEAAWEAVTRIGVDSSDRMIEGAIERACSPFVLQRQYNEECNRLMNGLWSELPGGTSREIEQAKDAVREAFSGVKAGTPVRKLEQLRDQALASFKNAITSRVDHENRTRLLGETIGLSYRLPKTEVEEAVHEARNALSQLPTGTPQSELQQARDVVFERHKKKHALIEHAAGGALREYIRKLETNWDFDKSTTALQSELAEAVRYELTEEIDGTESQEQANRLMRRIVREELDIG